MKKMELCSGGCQVDSVQTALHYLFAFHEHPRAKMDKNNQTKAFFPLPLVEKRKKEKSLRAIKWFPTMQRPARMDAGRPALHNQKERRVFFPPASLSLVHRCLCLTCQVVC